MVRFEGSYPISNEDLAALPVGDVQRAVDFYTSVLGFETVSTSPTAANVRRDAAQIGVVLKPDHKPEKAGSCYFAVSDVGALRQELAAKGAMPGEIEVQQHDGKDYEVFFVRECGSRELHDGYCFCFGKRLEL